MTTPCCATQPPDVPQTTRTGHQLLLARRGQGYPPTSFARRVVGRGSQSGLCLEVVDPHAQYRDGAFQRLGAEDHPKWCGSASALSLIRAAIRDPARRRVLSVAGLVAAGAALGVLAVVIYRRRA
jgi:hypothetical protein